MSSTAAARQLLNDGRVLEAERAYERVLEESPENVEALNVVALAALRGGRAQRALDLLKRAARSDPRDAATQHHLGRALEACGDSAAAAAAYAEALHIAPDFHLARLNLGICLERRGSGEEALVQYKRALDDAQREGRWLSRETTPPLLRPLVEHAVIAVRRGRHAVYSRYLAPLLQRYGHESLTRVERCLRIHLNEEAPVYPDAGQRPSFLFFPGLPPSPYLPRELFPWIDAMEAQTQAIVTELVRLLPSSSGRERVFGSEELERENLRGMEGAPSWNGYYFFRHGARRTDNCENCPVTTATLEALPLARIREHAPEVLFSVFTAGTHLMPHRGVTNTRVVGHLPLIVPPDCALKVGGEIHEWRAGRVVMFDDTYEHEAWNRSSMTRVVLIFDVWNPHLTEAERAALTDLVAEMGDFRRAVERV
jgi:aspartate beta-hydroxylase